MDLNLTTSLSLAGKTLSQANSNKLLAISKELLTLLASAGIIDSKVVAALEGRPTDWVPAEASASGSFVGDVERATWYARLQSAAKLFMRRFREVLEVPDDIFEREFGEVDRIEEARALVEDYRTILLAMPAQFKPLGINESIWPAIDAIEPFRMSAISAKGVETDEPVEVNCASIEFRCRAGGKGQPRLGNRSQFSGVLFRVDEASEAVPSKGPGLPLYIPASIAASALSQVHGLPLDAADNLSEHADENIVGVMLSAEINDQDFVVHGQLWPSSQGERVAAIAASKEDLGMSLTGDAIGHRAEVDGREVFWVDALALKGANILFAKKATFQKTRLLQASMRNPGQGFPHPSGNLPLAAASKPTQGDVSDMDIQELTNTVQALATQVQSIAASVSAIEDERKQNQAQIAAQATAQEKAQERQELVTSVTTEVTKALGEEIKSTIAAAMNPSGQPRRMTVSPVAVAANGAGEDTQQQVQLQLARLQGQLEQVRNTGDLNEELRLVDEIRNLGGTAV